jgi:hypothetical protein
VRIYCHFNILAPLAADFIFADYPYLRQITECAADLVIGSLERRFLRRMSHRSHFDVDRDVLRGLIRQEMLAAVRKRSGGETAKGCYEVFDFNDLAASRVGR